LICFCKSLAVCNYLAAFSSHSAILAFGIMKSFSENSLNYLLHTIFYALLNTLSTYSLLNDSIAALLLVMWNAITNSDNQLSFTILYTT